MYLSSADAARDSSAGARHCAARRCLSMQIGTLRWPRPRRALHPVRSCFARCLQATLMHASTQQGLSIRQPSRADGAGDRTVPNAHMCAQVNGRAPLPLSNVRARRQPRHLARQPSSSVGRTTSAAPNRRTQTLPTTKAVRGSATTASRVTLCPTGECVEQARVAPARPRCVATSMQSTA